FAEVQAEIRSIIPEAEVGFVVESIASPEPINLAWVESGVIGSFDGEIMVQLAKPHGPTWGYISAIRKRLKERFPELTVYFRPADATAQTLSAGTQTGIEVRIIGRDGQGNAEIARSLADEIRSIPGAVDVAQRQVRD